MASDVKELNPPIDITIGDSKLKSYTAPDNTGSPSYDLPAGSSYKVTGMSSKDPNWLRVEIKTTGDGGQPKYDSRWVYAGQDDEGNPLLEGTSVQDKTRLRNIATELTSEIGVDVAENTYTEQELDEMLATTNAATEIRDINSGYNDEYVVLYANNNQQNLDALYEHYLLLAVKAYGAPPQATPYADPRIIKLNTAFGPDILIGRKFAEVIVSNPTILSLCPGVIKYNSILAGTFAAGDEDSIVESAKQALSSDKNGKICEFQPCWYSNVKDQSGYIKFVNTLNWISAIAMSRQKINDDDARSLAERTFPGDRNNRTYKKFDWVDYDNPDNDVTRLFTGGGGNIEDYITGLIENASSLVSDLLNGTLGNEITESLASYKYINFYCSGSNNVRETFETSVRSTSLEDMINGSLSSTIKDVAFYTGGIIGDAAMEDINKWADETSSELGIDASILRSASEVFKGGHLVFPQIVDDCTYGKECQFTVRFVAGSGNCEARYLMRCEFNHLLAFALPRQLKGYLDMYTTPFLVRAVCRGRFNCELGVVTGVSISYGGQDDMAWTADGQPTEMEVTFSITPLYTKLYMTSSDDIKGMFLKNTGMIEYLLVNSAVDLRIPQLQMKLEIIKGLESGYITSKYNPENLFEKIASSKFIRNLMNF